MKAALPFAAITLLAIGCAPKPPDAPVPPRAVVAPVRTAPKIIVAPPAPVVALLEPYLVAATLPRAPSPSPLRGRILPDLPVAPMAPLPPIGAEPAPATPEPAPTPRRGPLVPNALVRLFQDERARSVDDARRRLAAATARTTQASAEAKRLWGFVKDGFVAQKQAESADAAARDATAEQADAQKALDDAQQRQRDARKDIETALKGVATLPTPFSLAQISIEPKAFQAVPNAYRLSVLGASPVTVTVQNGTLARRLSPSVGEAGAWLVRCVDPGKLKVGVGAKPATLIVRSLPIPDDKPKA